MKVESTMLPLGTIAPNFELKDVVTNKVIKLDDGNHHVATLIAFICNHCPFVKHINSKLIEVANRYIPKGIRFIAISSNDVDSYPDDSPEHMRTTAQALKYPFPYLYDETQEIARAYDAACTPDFFIFDSQLALVYRGQFDDSRPGNSKEISGQSICESFESLIYNRPINPIQKPSLGCNIKWK